MLYLEQLDKIRVIPSPVLSTVPHIQIAPLWGTGLPWVSHIVWFKSKVILNRRLQSACWTLILILPDLHRDPMRILGGNLQSICMACVWGCVRWCSTQIHVYWVCIINEPHEKGLMAIEMHCLPAWVHGFTWRNMPCFACETGILEAWFLGWDASFNSMYPLGQKLYPSEENSIKKWTVFYFWTMR